MEQQIQQLKQFLTRLPHAKLSAVVTLLVVVYLAYLLSKLVWLVWPQPVSTPLTPSHYSAGSKASSTTSVQNIIEQFLFGKKTVTNKTNTAQQNEVINNAPETRLSINLTGIVAVSNDDKAGIAIIESQGRQVSYLVEEVVQGTRAEVAQILPDRVILSVNGRFETLMLDGLDFSKKVSMPVLAAREAQDMGPQKIEQSELQINATADPDVKEAIIETREELLSEPGKLFDYIRVSQAMSDGELIGYRLSPGKEPALFKQMGLQNNDLAVAINGYQLTDLQQAMAAINELRNTSDATITIERDGEQIDVQFSLQ
ncbi:MULTISPECIES: type II secretion system protein GspC [Pseudoalteromonas]|jgi:general secretion pathway protein C|uniref:General secretion pathway protein C n=1 Tax=Pseudoalteromonas agarivorans DSM 14585 TaxID=1312369 RepID=A0ACA8E0S1_9GAMM|nr:MULTISPECIES: type II secretion system protein GspC [Pseudoalteromonas]MAJ41029.1 type II secretion system protein GspC [Pseudoalteromonadaceae bacterium]OUX84736.1 MAG: type II secretion system protein GspC [Pseudoalteromonas sp. TMED43]ATC83730.1 general secretion pathway protein C [Pseudoalteromonas agarivorans DSM 14585]MCK8097727.1 type II secretion system protein GspC [Pseudoalteromonas sp. 1CM17D]MDC9511501.1 type II secretion system protein GspC [Pseudoalteromonas sp. Angola-4]|tara:strand:+ start:2044 stop:2985 length:942 start_codon:yes stop_codon:yes gene_type:complete